MLQNWGLNKAFVCIDTNTWNPEITNDIEL